MKLQTYEVLTDLDFTDEDGVAHLPMKIGQVVYGWPYPDWGLCTRDEVAIVVTPMDVKTIYAVPFAKLKPREIVNLTVGVHEGMPDVLKPH